MLKGLDEVKWAELTHAHGSAKDVPEMIRNLASDDQAVREQALFTAFSNIYHQGSVYEATAHAVPFLIELAAEPSVQARDELLVLIDHLANGESSLDVHQHLDHVGQNLREDPDFEQKLKQELEWVAATSAEVAKRVPVLLQLLDDDDPAVRRNAAWVMASCESCKTDILPPLLELGTDDPDTATRAASFFALAALDADGQRAELTLRLEDKEPLVRLTTAMGMAFFLEADLPNRVFEVLLGALGEPEVPGFDILPFGEDYAADIGAALCRTPVATREQVVRKILDAAHKSTTAPAAVAGPLAFLAFGEPGQRSWEGELTAIQDEVLGFLSHRAWIKHNDQWQVMLDVVEVLKIHGLEKRGEMVVGYKL